MLTRRANWPASNHWIRIGKLIRLVAYSLVTPTSQDINR